MAIDVVGLLELVAAEMVQKRNPALEVVDVILALREKGFTWKNVVVWLEEKAQMKVSVGQAFAAAAQAKPAGPKKTRVPRKPKAPVAVANETPTQAEIPAAEPVSV